MMATVDIAKVQRAINNARAQGYEKEAAEMEAFLRQMQEPSQAQHVGRDWDTVASEAAQNFGPSLYNYGQDVLGVITNPVGTAATIADLGAGAVRAGAKALLPETVFNAIDSVGNQEATERVTNVANVVGGHYADRYGSWEGFKKHLGQDPVGVMSDLSLPVTGVGGLAVRAGGTMGRLGRYGQIVGDMMDPISGAIRTGNAGGRAISAIAGYSSGLGDNVGRDLFNAGRGTREEGEAARRGMREPPRDEVADDAFAKMQVRGREARQEYEREIAATKNSNARINWNNVFRSIHDMLRSNMTTRGNRFYGGEPGRRAVQQMLDTVHQYVLDPNLHNLEGLDALKQELAQLQEPIGSQPAKGAENVNRLVTQVIDGVRNEITRLEPSYATAMENYQTWKDLQGELRQAFSMHDKAAVDTIMRKLQSTTRNNAQTNYGSRGRLLDDLDTAAVPAVPARPGHRGRPALAPGTLRAELAGQAANAIMPRGISRAGGALAIPATIMALGATLASNPLYAALAAPFIPMASPRLVGETAHAAGRVAGLLDDFAAANPEVTRYARAVGGRTGRQVNRQVGQAINEREGVIKLKGVWYDAKGRPIDQGGK